MYTEEELAGIFHALSDPLRLRLLDLLPKAETPEPICVCDLAKKLEVSQPNMSHHLKILRSAGLIHCVKSGGFSYYQVDPEGVKAALEQVEKRLIHRGVEA